MCHDIGEAAPVHPLNLDNYRHKDRYARVDQIMDAGGLTCDMDKALFCALAETIRNHKQDYACVMMTAYLFSAVILEVHNIREKFLTMNTVCSCVMGGIRHRSVKVQTNKNGVDWGANPLCMHYTHWLVDKDILPTRAIKLRKIADISIFIVLRATMLTDNMQSFPWYAQVLNKTMPCVPFITAHCSF